MVKEREFVLLFIKLFATRLGLKTEGAASERVNTTKTETLTTVATIKGWSLYKLDWI